MKATIVLINRNGGEYLRRALRGLKVALEHGQASCQNVEFIFVDNGSTDESKEIALQEMRGVPCEWMIVDETEPGVNSARLAGLRAAKGRYVIFTDNDLDFDPGWLVGYLDAFAAHPDCRVFAGRVLVGNVEGDVPPWLDLTGPYSRPSIVCRCDNGDTDQSAALGQGDIEGPIGGNMAIERSVFEEHGGFDTKFGLRPGSSIAGAEAEFFHRLANHRERFVYVPAACVYHPLKRNQISKTYFRRRLAGVGRVQARMQRLDGYQTKRIFGVKRYLFRQLVEAWLRYGAAWFQPCPKKRFYRRCEVSIVWGQIQEDFESLRKSARDANNPPVVVSALK